MSRKRCACGAVMAQGPKAGKKGTATVPFCPIRHSKKRRPRSSPRTKEDQVREMTPEQRKVRRLELRKKHALWNRNRDIARQQRPGLVRRIMGGR